MKNLLQNIKVFQVIAILLTIVLVIGAFSGMYFLMMMLNSEKATNNIQIALPVLLVGSLVILLIALAAMVSAFSSLALTNRSLALGLPQGTVRALIAISLILIFMMTSTYLFNQLRSHEFHSSDGLSKEQLNTFLTKLAGSDTKVMSISEDVEGKMSVTTMTEVNINDKRADLALQILTTISTLLVAVSGFYFGSRGSSSSIVDENDLNRPLISTMKFEEDDPEKSLACAVIYGQHLAHPAMVRLVCQDGELIALHDKTLSNDTMIRCVFSDLDNLLRKPPQPPQPLGLSASLDDAENIKQTKPEVTKLWTVVVTSENSLEGTKKINLPLLPTLPTQEV